MNRNSYNRYILDKCVRLLSSTQTNQVLEGVFWAAYLIEQAFKLELKILNPLLCYDFSRDAAEKQIKTAQEALSFEELQSATTINAHQLRERMCSYRVELSPYKGLIKELFDLRNTIVHSVDDVPLNTTSAGHTAVSVLRICSDYVSKHSGVTPGTFNPLTASEFEQLQEERRNERMQALQTTLEEYQRYYAALSSEIVRSYLQDKPKGSYDHWIEDTLPCPACQELALDKHFSIAVEPDGTMMGAGYNYECRVCGLDLTEYEFELVQNL